MPNCGYQTISFRCLGACIPLSFVGDRQTGRAQRPLFSRHKATFHSSILQLASVWMHEWYHHAITSPQSKGRNSAWLWRQCASGAARPRKNYKTQVTKESLFCDNRCMCMEGIRKIERSIMLPASIECGSLFEVFLRTRIRSLLPIEFVVGLGTLKRGSRHGAWSRMLKKALDSLANGWTSWMVNWVAEFWRIRQYKTLVIYADITYQWGIIIKSKRTSVCSVFKRAYLKAAPLPLEEIHDIRVTRGLAVICLVYLILPKIQRNTTVPYYNRKM